MINRNYEYFEQIINNSTKNDDEKDRYDLICYEFIEQIAKILTVGAKKYGEWNWLGLDKARIISAMQRHFVEFMLKEDNDTETGCSHLAHVACNAMMLDYMIRHKNVTPDEIQQM